MSTSVLPNSECAKDAAQGAQSVIGAQLASRFASVLCFFLAAIVSFLSNPNMRSMGIFEKVGNLCFSIMV